MSSSAPPVPYGASVAAVEPHGLDAIDARERHGRPRDLFSLWFAANAETATFAVGILTTALFGTSFAGAAFGLVVGNLLAYAVVGLLSRGGPRFGQPQMVLSRRAFGRDGNVAPAVLAFFAGVGWFTINSVFGAQALTALTHLGYLPALALLVAAQVVLAVYGHNAIHAFERYAGVLLALGFVVIAAGTLPRAHLGAGFDPHAPAAGGGEIAGIVFAAALAFSYAIGWGPAASDYARYLPGTSSPRAVTVWAMLGGFLPSTLLELLGAAAVTAVRTPAIATATPADTIGLLFGHGALAVIGLLTVLLGTLSANVLNLYSSALSGLVAWDARRRPRFALGAGAGLALLAAVLLLAAGANDPTARYAPWLVAAVALAAGALAAVVVRWTLARWQAALTVGLLGGALALAGSDPASTAHLYTNFLSLLSTWAAPWAAVMLATRGATPRAYGSAALVAWLAGIAASLPFWQQSWFTGPIAVAHPQLGDLSYFVAFAVAYAVAAGFGRTLANGSLSSLR
jgi:nucleobase:cation symporter-1, NCS1 family